MNPTLMTLTGGFCRHSGLINFHSIFGTGSLCHIRLITRPICTTITVSARTKSSCRKELPNSARFLLEAPHGRDTSFLKNFDYKEILEKVKKSDFESLGISDDIVHAIRSIGLKKPSTIQVLAVPEILEGKDVLLASETGSGKTLSFLAPIVHKMKEEEKDGLLILQKRPRAVVLVPSKELVKQVEGVAKTLSHHAKFRVEGIYDRKPKCIGKFEGAIDMIVATPKKFLYYVENGTLSLADVRYLAIDEIDTMLDKDFEQQIQDVMEHIRKANDRHFQIILSCATLTIKLRKKLNDSVLNIDGGPKTSRRSVLQIVSPKLHKTVDNLKQRFIRLEGYGTNKQKHLMKVLLELPPIDSQTMVFCNSIGSCKALCAWLSRVPEIKDIVGDENALEVFHGRLSMKERAEILRKFSSGQIKLLICTDLASRGIDTNVEHVVLYDFPMTTLDYLHRVGRTARAGKQGKATCLVGKKDATLAAAIQEAIRKKKIVQYNV